MRDRFGQLSQLQPAGTPLIEALRMLGAAAALPATLSPSGTSAEEAYDALLRQTLEGFPTSLEADVAALEHGRYELPTRQRLALEFRIEQKRGLRNALDRSYGSVRERVRPL